MPTNGQSTDLTAILTATRLPFYSGDPPLFPAERVYVSLASNDQFEGDIPADRFMVIQPTDFTAIEGMVTGGGNQQLSTDAELKVSLWNRFEVDAPLTDADSLMDATNGILQFWKTAVLATLSIYMPLDPSTSNGLLLEPMRFRGWQVIPRRQKSPWLVISSRWQIRYNQVLV